MSRLAARQWPVLWCCPPLPRLARAAPVRCYASTPRPATKGTVQPAKLNSAIVIPHSITENPTSILQHIEPLGIHLHGGKLCVVLVTPSFASWIEDDAHLGRVLYRIYGKTLLRGRKKKNVPPLHIQVLCAVVDRLPVGRAISPKTTLHAEASHRATEVPVAGSGFEGIAYTTLPLSLSVPSKELSPHAPGAIDFILRERVIDNTFTRDLVRLPLANTVFQTGKTTTMSLSKWTINDVHATKPLTLSTKKSVSRHGIHIADLDGSPDDLVSAFSIPLIPLTVPRLVEGCMGNIIRRLTGPGGETITASSELEDVVPRFFKSRGEPAQSTTAWALVVPRANVDAAAARTSQLLDKLGDATTDEDALDKRWEQLWRCDPPAWNTLVSQQLAEGARLHRVLSGGGGWGMKVGLISLDPVPLNEADRPPNTEEFSSNLPDPKDFASTLSPVVQDGDSIQFFIPPTPYLTAEVARTDREEQLKAISGKGAVGWEIGTIPSTVDSIPGQSWQHSSQAATGSSGSSGSSVFRNTFGALTEGPLTIVKYFNSGSAAEDPVTTTTAVDVPLSRYWATKVEKVKSKKPLKQDLPFPGVYRLMSRTSGNPLKEMGRLRMNNKGMKRETPQPQALESAQVAIKNKLHTLARQFGSLAHDYKTIMLSIQQRDFPSPDAQPSKRISTRVQRLTQQPRQPTIRRVSGKNRSKLQSATQRFAVIANETFRLHCSAQSIESAVHFRQGIPPLQRGIAPLQRGTRSVPISRVRLYTGHSQVLVRKVLQKAHSNVNVTRYPSTPRTRIRRTFPGRLLRYHSVGPSRAIKSTKPPRATRLVKPRGGPLIRRYIFARPNTLVRKHLSWSPLKIQKKKSSGRKKQQQHMRMRMRMRMSSARRRRDDALSRMHVPRRSGPSAPRSNSRILLARQRRIEELAQTVRSWLRGKTGET